MAELPSDLPVLLFSNQQDWEDWLAPQADQAQGVWIQFAKKASGIASVTYDEALEVALCHGWIDGLKKSLDERFFLQRFTPRRARSMWSKRNVGIVERLSKQGRMRPRGLREVEAAKADGRWAAAYEAPKSDNPHPGLLAAIAKNKKARAAFHSLTERNRAMMHHHVHEAKKPETRTRRIEKLVAMLIEGKKL